MAPGGPSSILACVCGCWSFFSHDATKHRQVDISSFNLIISLGKSVSCNFRGLTLLLLCKISAMNAQSRGALLGLPGEIRAMILHHLLVPKSRHLLFKIGFQRHSGLCLEVLRACRQLLNEGLPLLYGRSVIEADFSPAKHERIFHSINQSCITMIRRLSLPADNDIDDIEESRDLVQGAKNLRLATLLQDYPSQLAGLQMLRLEFEQSYPPPWDEYDPYFEHLKIWDEFDKPETTEERRTELCNIALDFAFQWTVLRAHQTICERKLKIAGHVYECVDRIEGSCWIVFTKGPLRSPEDASLEVGIESGSVSSFNTTQPWHKN
jgi:hypothetical protein